MSYRILFPVISMLFLAQAGLSAQQSDTVYKLSAIIYDDLYIPVSATHVININTHEGDVTDSLGIFNLSVHEADTLLIRNIAFRDTLVPVREVHVNRHIRLQRMRYPLKEARVFEWGASYEDFQEAFIGMPMQQTLVSSLDLPRQDPEKVPEEMDEKAVKSAGLLLTSPISFFYYNFSKHAKSARKFYWLEKNQDKHDQFKALTGSGNLADITGLKGSELEDFHLFLSQRMVCDFHCSELDILNEIYGLWDVYQDLRERGMLNESPEPKKKGE
jgi:hypothetical protein